VCLLSAAALSRCVDADPGVWTALASHWDELVPDAYAAELGTTRLRRYGHFVFTCADGSLRPLPHGAFVQPDDSNPLYIDRDRTFEPLTDAFAGDPLLSRLIRLLGGVATVLDDVAQWSVKVTPFRVLASPGGAGEPAPEGRHRDGVTLVSSLLIGRDNAVGGESTVYDLAGTPLLTATLSEPGTLLLNDDRATLHSVTAIRPSDPFCCARRDVLVVTFAPCLLSSRPPPPSARRARQRMHAGAAHPFRVPRGGGGRH
jgi:hypothetical protein